MVTDSNILLDTSPFRGSSNFGRQYGTNMWNSGTFDPCYLVNYFSKFVSNRIYGTSAPGQFEHSPNKYTRAIDEIFYAHGLHKKQCVGYVQARQLDAFWYMPRKPLVPQFGTALQSNLLFNIGYDGNAGKRNWLKTLFTPE